MRNRNENVEGLTSRDMEQLSTESDGALHRQAAASAIRRILLDEDVDRHLKLRVPVKAGPFLERIRPKQAR
jgi:hypothetical protein